MYRNEELVYESRSSANALINNLIPNEVYRIRITAFNDFGTGESVTTEGYTRPQGAYVASPQIVHVFKYMYICTKYRHVRIYVHISTYIFALTCRYCVTWMLIIIIAFNNYFNIYFYSSKDF